MENIDFIQAGLRMKIDAKLLSGIIALALLLACRPSPNAGSYKGRKSGDGKPGAVRPGKDDPENTSMDPDDPDSISSNVVGGADLNLTRETLSKIMEAAGGDEDDKCNGKTIASKSQLRLLTRDEYQNTIKDILGVTTDFRSSLPTESVSFGFDNNADGALISDAHASAYLDASIAIASEAKSKLKTLISCEESAGLGCGQKVVDELAPKLWRRPLEAAEKASLIAQYKTGLAASPAEGMTLLLSSILLSPDFLYRTEIGKNKALTPYELASALSYFFWGTAPDATLQGLASSGEISKNATLMVQAQRLLSDKRSRFATVKFANGWMNANAIANDDKDPKEFPAFTDVVKTAMAAEAEDTFDYIARQPTSTFETLFNADFSIGSAKLASYYKGQSVTEGDVTKIKFPNTPRKGLLGLGSILAHNSSPAETHPVLRGNFILEKVFCSIPQSTPKGLDVQVPEFKVGMTTRERFAVHTSNPSCSGCHVAIDGIGFGMEDFDGAGVYRDMDNGKKVDNSGELVDIDGANTKFKGVGELSSYIATSSQAKRCYVVEWYRFAHGYAERPQDICAIRDIANKFEKGSMTLPQLLINIVTHPSYAKKE